MLHVPVLGQTYYGGRGMGAFKVSGGGEPEGIRTAPPAPGETLTAVSSRSHPSPDLQKILDRYNVGQSTPAGSAYKFCLVADGRAHLYARTNPTWEWDTAAGQAIVEAAGGAMARLDGGPFLYNKQDLRNPGFIVTGWVDSE
jgi:3'(2'), 5'-bisphosphate nucleotidase